MGALLFIAWLVGLALSVASVTHTLPGWVGIPGFIIIVTQFIAWNVWRAKRRPRS